MVPMHIMENKDTCAYCGGAPRHTCTICHKKVCSEHFDISTGICLSCKGRGRAVCAVCYSPAEHRCKLCGQMVCGSHYDPNIGICTMCRTSGRREVMRHSQG